MDREEYAVQIILFTDAHILTVHHRIYNFVFQILTVCVKLSHV